MIRLDSTNAAQSLDVESMESDYNEMASATLILHRGNSMNLYWTFAPTLENSYDTTDDLVYLEVTVLNEDVVSSVFGDAGSISVIGLYVGIVYTAGSVLRIIFDRYSELVIYEELPDTEKLREIIEGIDIA